MRAVFLFAVLFICAASGCGEQLPVQDLAATPPDAPAMAPDGSSLDLTAADAIGPPVLDQTVAALDLANPAQDLMWTDAGAFPDLGAGDASSSMCPQKPCANGQACSVDGDCASLNCAGGVCVAASCMDGKRDGTETDADCGGVMCPKCADGKMCAVMVDCQSGICMNGHCAPKPAVSFAAAMLTDVPIVPTFVAIGDFNGDQKLDVVATLDDMSGNPGKVAVLLNQGGGVLKAPVLQAANRSLVYIVPGDFNRDGRLDSVVLDVPNTSSAEFMAGNGDGTLNAPNFLLQATRPAAAFDFNADGKLDLATSNPNGFAVALGNGNGSFGQNNGTPSAAPRSLRVGDFNGDGKADLLVLGTDVLLCYQGNGDGTFQARVQSGPFNMDALLLGVDVGDFDRDGKLDAAGIHNQKGAQYFRGRGDCSFKLAGTIPVPNNPGEILTADFNVDGKSDLAVETDTGVAILIGDGAGGFAMPIVPIATRTVFLVSADLNGDQKPDVIGVVPHMGGSAISVNLNTSP